MDPVEINLLAAWAAGELLRGNPAAVATGVCTDSRALQRGDLFVALRGERFDGHAFVPKSAEMGAAGAVVDAAMENLPEDFAVIRAGDTLAALQGMALGYRRTLPLAAIGITGSNGKTSTKDFTAAVLGGTHRVTRTEGNLNNHIGLPITILRASVADQFGIFELGMNHAGEIAPLARIARPDAAIITNVGVAHIEHLGSREAIAEEKGMLAEAVGPQGAVILTVDDPFTDYIAGRTEAKVIRAGIGAGDVYASDIVMEPGGSRFTVNAWGESMESRISIPGRHMVQNAMLAVAAGLHFGVSLADCLAGLGEVRLTKGRLEQKTIRGISILDDSYNANPDSMVAALQTLGQMPGRRIAVLGQMNELGAQSDAGHRRVGEAAAREKIDCVITVGGIASGIADAAREHGVKHALTPETTTEAAALLRSLARHGDTVLIKGSRSVKMETIVEELARA